MILSVSRRTDIPAFYSEWFMNRLREGYVLVRNPFNVNLISEVKISSDNVDCIVFWTKNSKPLHKYLNEIDGLGYKYYFQYTITPYHKNMEGNVANKTEIIKSFQYLSEKIGKEKVILRYDPVILSNKYNIDYHKIAFVKICNILAPYTEKVVFSFLDGYKKIAKNMKDLNIKEITTEEMNILAKYFSEVANEYGLKIESCAEDIDLEKYNISHGKCIDDNLIERIIGHKIKAGKDNQRLACGCVKSIDIGEYNTCLHNCLYCYANTNKDNAFQNYKKHNKNSPILIGEIDNLKDKIVERSLKDTKSLKDTGS